MSIETIGTRLSALKAASGLSLSDIAKRGGLRGPSSTQRYFSADYAPEFLSSKVARKLIAAFPDKYRQEIMEMAGMGTTYQPASDAAATGEAKVSRQSDVLDLLRLRPADRLAMLTIYNSLVSI